MDSLQPAAAERSTGFTSLLKSRASVIGVTAGFVYGLTARFFASPSMGGVFAVMTLGFLLLVPFVLGALTVAPVRHPSIAYRVFAPWIPMTLVVLASALIGWEGSICIIMAMPVLLVFASVGGLIGGMTSLHRWGVRPALIALPFVVSPLENRVSAPVRLVETVTRIEIAAPVAAVWPLVTSVDSIQPAEQRPALFTRLGFPAPVSATITGSGVGAIRQARFERGLVFTETVTHWEPERLLGFTIDPNTESIPPTTLDPHVTIGGPFFDVLTGTYELESRDHGRSTHLILRSRHRVSTRFNIYSVWWAERIMASIQWNILRVHKDRAERVDGARPRFTVER